MVAAGARAPTVDLSNTSKIKQRIIARNFGTTSATPAGEEQKRWLEKGTFLRLQYGQHSVPQRSPFWLKAQENFTQTTTLV